jgi:hypothetical protein
MAVNGSFVQQWPFDKTRQFQNWFLRYCTRASYDGNVFISRLLKLDKETESLLSKCNSYKLNVQFELMTIYKA